MIWRHRQLSGVPAVFLVGSVILVVLAALYWVVLLSLDKSSSLHTCLNNNLVAGIVVALAGAILTALWAGRRGFSVPVPVFCGAACFQEHDRPIIGRIDLERLFRCDNHFELRRDDGWEIKGEGRVGKSTAIYNHQGSDPVSIAALFRPVAQRPENGHWRCGFIVLDDQENDLAVFHIDNANLVVGYVGGVKVLSTPATRTLANRWCHMSLQVSDTNCGTWRFFAHLDRQSFCLGDIEKPQTHLRIGVRAWSDDRKKHHVSVRDITVSHPVA